MRLITALFTALCLLLAGTNSDAASKFRRGVQGSHGGGQSFVGVALSNATFIPNGSTAANVGSVIVTLTPASPASTAVITFGGGGDDASFQLTNSGNLPTTLQAKASTAAGTYTCVKLTATQSGISGSPFTTGCLSITGSAATVISTFPIINDSAIFQAAGQPTQTFNQAFKDGDICGGTAPQFIDANDGTTVQPMSASPANARTYWPSGCLRFAVFALRPTFDIGGGTFHSVQVATGGAWPANSSRTLAEVYSQNLKMNFLADPSFPTPFSDTFSFSLDGGSSNYKTVKWLDGAAGAYWKISVKGVGGSNSAQRVADFYVQALNDSSGNLGGFRWLGTLRQPFYNLDSPTKTQLVLLAPNLSTPTLGTNWQVNAHGGGTTTTAPPWPYGGATQAFTVTGGVASTNSANTFFQGSNDGRQVVPVATHCGPCPSGITNNGSYFVLAFNGSPVFNFANGSAASGDEQFTPGDGTGTISPVVYESQFNRFTMAGPDAHYLFFQGSGTLASETTLRIKQDKSYWSSAAVMPPYNLSYTAASLTDAADQSALTYSKDWSPYSIGNLEWSQSAAGNQQFIGPLPNAASADFIAQTSGTDKLIRMIGLSAGLNVIDFKNYNPGNANHDQPLNFLAGTYTGLSATGPTGAVNNTVYEESRLGAGFTLPAINSQIGFDSGNFEHKPRFAAWAYMKTGELQYLDYVDELGQCALSCEEQSLRNAGFPTVRTGVCSNWGDSTSTAEARAIGWGCNDLAVAALVHPFDPTNPTALDHNGTQYGLYLHDAVANAIDHMADIQAGLNNSFDFFTGGSAATTYLSPLGYWTALHGTLGYMYDAPEWERTYVFDWVAWAAMSGNTTAKTVLRNNGTWQNHIRTANGGYGLYGYYEVTGNGATASCGAINHCTKNLNTANNQFGVNVITAWSETGAGIGFSHTGFTSSPTRYFRLLNGGPNRYTVGNGDIFLYPPSTMKDFDGTNFNLYPSDGPSSVTEIPATTGSFPTGVDYMPVHDIATCPGAGCNTPATPDYPIVVRHLANWARAILGTDANYAAVVSDAENRMALSNQGAVTELFVGSRWAIQNHFGP